MVVEMECHKNKLNLGNEKIGKIKMLDNGSNKYEQTFINVKNKESWINIKNKSTVVDFNCKCNNELHVMSF